MIELEEEGGIRTIRLARPPVNALNGELITTLDRLLEAAPGEGVRGIVLTGAGGRFTGGLDLQTLLALDEPGLREFIRAFFDLLTRIARSPVPIVAAINGHSPAGGAVMSLFCDRRIMAEGDYRIGLNEVQVGIFPGQVIYRALERLVGPARAADLLPLGRLVPAAEALALGLVDELAPRESVEARARAWLEVALALPPQAYAATRRLVREDLVALMTGLHGLELEGIVRAWRSPEARATLSAALERLGRK
jgi:enoyl-CoA hydratase/carnithine racemase